MVAVRFKITNQCNNSEQFGYNNLPQYSDWFKTSPTSAGGPYAYYTQIYFPSSINVNFCQLNILSFSPPIIRAGVGDTLTIRGYGVNPSASSILFKSSSDGGATFAAPCNNHDYVLKNDSVIQLIMPSVIFNSVQDSWTGIGKVGLFNGVDTIISTNSLLVKYAIINDVAVNQGVRKFQQVLQKNDTTAYVFHLDSASVNSVPGARHAIEKAFEDWRCFTHVNFRLGNDVSNVLNDVTDGVNTIFFFDSISNPVLFSEFSAKFLTGKASKSRDTCADFKSYVKEADISFILNSHYINPQLINWNTACDVGFDNPQYFVDFYHNILHELGHVHTLDHVNDSLGVMYYTTNPFVFTPYGQRADLSSSSYLLEAGLHSISKATEAGFNCGYVPMLSQNISFCNTGIDNFDIESVINIYPNPTNNILNIDLGSSQILNLKVTIVNSIGSVVLSQKLEQSITQLSLKNLANGMCNIIISNNNSYHSFKIIKQ